MKKIIKKIIVKSRIIELGQLICIMFSIFPISNKKIMFVNFSGRGYGDNPKYIADELIKQGYEYKMFWAVKEISNKNNVPAPIKQVKINSIKYFYHLMTSKVWINNSRFDLWIKKRKKQYYIQTWHGSFGIKKVEFDAYDTLSDYYKKVMKNDNKMIDLIISNCDYNTNLVFRKAFRYRGEILKCGIPRDDIFVKNPTEYIQKVKKTYNIPKENRILLYAPTFRINYTKNPYDIDFIRLKDILEKKYNEKYSVLIRLHPRVASKSKELIKNIDNYIDVSTYNDMQELICACNILITDYSSTMADALVSNKAVVLYANDIDDYEKERGYIFDYNKLPFKKAKNNNELINIFKNNSLNELKKEYRTFLEKEIGMYKMGEASITIGNLIRKKTQEKN